MEQANNTENVMRQLRRLEVYQELLNKFYSAGMTTCISTTRTVLLFASVLKLIKMTVAVRLLANDLFVEEILAMNRTMAEITINAAYLQVAEDRETDRFQHFDTQAAFRHANRLRPHTTLKVIPDEIAKIDSIASLARAITGRKDSDPSWSERTLLQRAEHSDIATQLDLMKKLALTSYAYGHSAVHGTFDSLDYFISRTSDENREMERLETLYIALSGVNFTLYVMCLYLNSLLRLNASQEIERAARL